MDRSRQIKKHQIILYQGEVRPQLYVIKKGIVKMYTVLSNGNEIVVALYSEGDSFPTYTDSKSMPTALFYYQAMTDVQLQNVAPEDLKMDARDQSRHYLGALLHINALVQMNAHDKLVHTLRYLAVRFGVPLINKNFIRINLKLTQQDLADMSNMSRETTSIELAKLKDSGVVVEKNKHYALNMSKLRNLIDDELIKLDIST